MKYENAQNILPKDILEILQDYIEGGYLYVPSKSEKKKSWGELSGSKAELQKRNMSIYDNYNLGLSIDKLSKKYYLSESSIRRIISECKKSLNF